MKCSKCGAELKTGCMYCSVCGQEAQIVSDYNLLEDDMLRELLKKEEVPQKKEVRKKAKTNKKKKGKKPVIILSIAFAVIVLIVVTFLVVSNINKNSFDYQYKKGETCFHEKNYKKALTCFSRALEINSSSIETRMQIAAVHIAMDNRNAAISMLQEIITLDNGNKEAYELLIGLYQEKKDYEAILKLKEGARDESILSLFTEFEVKKPEFSLVPGTYSEYITVGILTDAEYLIYYTIDSSDPKENGIKYTETIRMEEQGEIFIRAVACNKYGIYSEELTGKFIVKFKKPDRPMVSPDGGSFTEPEKITVTVPEGARVYYTWDHSIPTEDSAEYTDPLNMPEGNSILTLLLIDKFGMKSDIWRCNYRYMP